MSLCEFGILLKLLPCTKAATISATPLYQNMRAFEVYSIPPLIEYRPWTGFVFNSGNIQYVGAYHILSYSYKWPRCPRSIFGLQVL